MAGDDVLIASGYGLRLYVDRGHLVVEDGLGRDRRTVRLNRATSRLRRLVVLGHTGYVTFEALRWIRDVGAAFVQIDRDGSLVTVTAPERLHESKLRRAQVLAAENERGRLAIIELLQLKLERQADLVERRLSHLKSSIVRDHKHRILIADAIREQAQAMQSYKPWAELRKLESIAGRYYWQTWTRVPVKFEKHIAATVPEHWHRAGPRTSRVDRQWPRRATTPAHAALNYAYAILEAETTIAGYAIGFDPSIGLMHADVRYRGSLAADLMEPLRPAADEVVLDLLEQRQLGRGDVLETKNGVCRLGPRVALELSRVVSDLRTSLYPLVEQLAQRLSREAQPTPLTRARHRAALMKAKTRSG